MSSPVAALVEPLLEERPGEECIVVPSSREESRNDEPRAVVVTEHHHHHHSSNDVFVQHGPSFCSLVGNALWILLGGWHLCLAWIIIGILLCCTLVGIPAGMQCFHIAQFVLLPFGRTITTMVRHRRRRCLTCGCHCVGNIVWAITVGWVLALHALVTGIVCCATILGIPWGLQCFRFLRVCIAPFGVRFCSPTERWVDTAVRQLEEEYEPLV